MHDGTLVRQYNAAEFESDYKSFMNDILMKGLSASGYLQDGFSFYDVFGAPGSGAIFGNAMQDIEQVRGWNAAGVMANSFQTVMSTVFVFCSPEEASRLEYQTGEDAVSASRVTGIEHYRVPSDWVQAPLSHPVARIMATPNPWEDESVWKFRLQQNIEAHGVAYVLVLPNEYGEPKWMFVIPKNGMRPEMASAEHPEGTYRTGQLSRLSNWTPSTKDSTPETFQEALAWISNRQFSAKYVIPIGIPSLLYMDDYFNPTSAMADVLDTDSEIHRSRRNTLRRQASKGPRIEPKDGVDLQPEEWEQILEAYTTEYCGSENAGRPRRTPRNVTITDDSHNSREMEFTQSSGQIRDDILGLRGVPLGFFGLGQQGGYAGVVAQVKSYAALRSQPMQRIISGQLTLGLRSFFKDKAHKGFMVVMQAASLDDPQQKLQELTADMQFLAPHMTVGEYCKMRNIELQDDSKYDMPLVPQPAMGGIPGLPGQEGPKASGELPNIGAALSGVEAKPEAPQQSAQEAPQATEFENAKKGIEETVKAYSSDSVRRAVAAVLLTKFGMSEQAANAILQEVDSEKAKQQAEYDKAEQAKKTLLAKSYFDDMFAGMRSDGEHTRYAAKEIEIDTSDVDLSYRDRYTPVGDSSGELRKCLDRLMFGDIGRNRRRFQKSIVDNCGTGAGGFQPGNTCATKSGYAGPKRGQLGHEFTTPITGPTGAKLTGYDWRHELVELDDDRIKRVSVWEESEKSAATGRQIVHLWSVTKANGEKATMSFESALTELGYVDDVSSQNIRTIAAAVLKRNELESVYNRTGDESIKTKIVALGERIEILNQIANDKDNTPEGRRSWVNRAEIAKHVLQNHTGELSEFELLKNGQVSPEWKRKISSAERSVERVLGKYSSADTDRKLTNWYRNNHENIRSVVNSAESLVRDVFPYADEILLMNNTDDISDAIRRLGRVRDTVADAMLRYYSTGRQMSYGYLAESPKGEIVRVDGSDEQDVRFFFERNFERISDIVGNTGEMIAMGRRPADPPASLVLPPSSRIQKSLFAKSTVDTAAQRAATFPKNRLPEPSEAQKKAGNYRKGRCEISGLRISVENPAGSVRSGVDADGNKWSVKMKSHYGYVRGTVGFDKDHFDVFIRPGTQPDYEGPVFVVSQANADGTFDEHKAVIGVSTEDAARKEYLQNYNAGWESRILSIREMPFAAFVSWIHDTGETGPQGGHVLKSMFNKASDGNCGTGAGGFQPGNTCSKGDYSGPKRGQIGHEFTTPIEGPSGAKLTGYDWRHELIELDDDRIKRVSVWEESELSDVTGRRIVHLWDVVKSNGEKSTMSFESALVELGYLDDLSSQNVRTLAAAVLRKIALQSALGKTNDRTISDKIAALDKRIELLNRVANDSDNTPDGRRDWIRRAEIARHIISNHMADAALYEILKNGSVDSDWHRNAEVLQRKLSKSVGQYSTKDSDRKLTNWYRNNHETVHSSVKSAELWVSEAFPFGEELLTLENKEDVSNAISRLGRVKGSQADALLRYFETGRQMSHGYLAESQDKQYVRIDGSDEDDVRFFLERGYRRVSEITPDTGEVIGISGRKAKPAAEIQLPAAGETSVDAKSSFSKSTNWGTGDGRFNKATDGNCRWVTLDNDVRVCIDNFGEVQAGPKALTGKPIGGGKKKTKAPAEKQEQPTGVAGLRAAQIEDMKQAAQYAKDVLTFTFREDDLIVEAIKRQKDSGKAVLQDIGYAMEYAKDVVTLKPSRSVVQEVAAKFQRGGEAQRQGNDFVEAIRQSAVGQLLRLVSLPVTAAYDAAFSKSVDCGTGAGGFQPGNTCASKGDGMQEKTEISEDTPVGSPATKSPSSIDELMSMEYCDFYHGTTFQRLESMFESGGSRPGERGGFLVTLDFDHAQQYPEFPEEDEEPIVIRVRVRPQDLTHDPNDANKWLRERISEGADETELLEASLFYGDGHSAADAGSVTIDDIVAVHGDTPDSMWTAGETGFDIAAKIIANGRKSQKESDD